MRRALTMQGCGVLHYLYSTMLLNLKLYLSPEYLKFRKLSFFGLVCFPAFDQEPFDSIVFCFMTLETFILWFSFLLRNPSILSYSVPQTLEHAGVYFVPQTFEHADVYSVSQTLEHADV